MDRMYWPRQMRRFKIKVVPQEEMFWSKESRNFELY